MTLPPEQSDSEKLHLDEDSEEIVDPDAAGEELSLEQLSRAYADVLQGREDDESVYDEAAVDDPIDEADLEDDPETETDDLSGETAGIEAVQDFDPAEEDEQDNAGCPIEPETILEAILFVGCPPGNALKARQIAAIMRDVSPKEIKGLVKKLNQGYEASHAPYRIVSDSGNLKMELVDDEEMSQVRSQFYGEVRHAKLNQNAIDVLAVVAYNQPVSKEEVEKIRTRPSGSVLSQMVRRQLLRFDTSETKPRRRMYSTTDRFLELFHLDTIGDLPQTNTASDLDELAD
ncbi:MAG: SMC-Scp complex subunit ScpB [Mariniblastus sp.]|nr:SMC-Scp complex subunit ScpB [Mariniblastus sp.]